MAGAGCRIVPANPGRPRIGIDRIEDYGFVRDFVGPLADAGCAAFIVHARNAWLHGLSPRENREVPPLRYSFVQRLKQDFADSRFILNGGLTTLADVRAHGARLDGVMLGRAAYHDPFLLAAVDVELFGEAAADAPARVAVVARMTAYLEREVAAGEMPRHIVRHMLGLYQGVRGARQWRRLLSDAGQLEACGARILERALQAVEPQAA